MAPHVLQKQHPVGQHPETNKAQREYCWTDSALDLCRK